MAGGAAAGRAPRFGDLIEPASRAEAAAAPGRRARRPGGGAAGRRPAAHRPPLPVRAPTGGCVAYLVDVSEQKQLELQLAQSQKMQAIGQLAGGVAHDFNNLLTAIQLRLDELLHRHPVGDPSYEGLNEIRQTGARAADLVRKLLAFSRKQTVQRETLDLGELISRVRGAAAPPAARGRQAGDRLRPQPAPGARRQGPARDRGDEPGGQRPRRHAAPRAAAWSASAPRGSRQAEAIVAGLRRPRPRASAP